MVILDILCCGLGISYSSMIGDGKFMNKIIIQLALTFMCKLSFHFSKFDSFIGGFTPLNPQGGYTRDPHYNTVPLFICFRWAWSIYFISKECLRVFCIHCWTYNLAFVKCLELPADWSKWIVYRLLNQSGKVYDCVSCLVCEALSWLAMQMNISWYEPIHNYRVSQKKT